MLPCLLTPGFIAIVTLDAAQVPLQTLRDSGGTGVEERVVLVIYLAV